MDKITLVLEFSVWECKKRGLSLKLEVVNFWLNFEAYLSTFKAIQIIWIETMPDLIQKEKKNNIGSKNWEQK